MCLSSFPGVLLSTYRVFFLLPGERKKKKKKRSDERVRLLAVTLRRPPVTTATLAPYLPFLLTRRSLNNKTAQEEQE